MKHAAAACLVVALVTVAASACAFAMTAGDAYREPVAALVAPPAGPVLPWSAFVARRPA